ncbi:MAG: hypothetical protein ACI8RD_003296 [Bacillariaceae sp.]|jgi:hypothetical protein
MNSNAGSTSTYFPEINEDRSSNPNLSPLNEIIHELKRKNVVAAAASGGPNQMSLALDSRSDPWGSSEAALGVVDDGIVTSVSSSGGSGGGYRTPLSIPASTTTDRKKIPNSYDNNPKDVLCTCQQQQRKHSVSSPNHDKSSSSQQQQQQYTQQKSTSIGYSTSSVRSPIRDNDGGEIENIDDNARCLDCGKPLPSGDTNPTSPRQKLRLNSLLASSHNEMLEAPRHAEELLQVTPQLRTISSSSTDMNVTGASTSNNILSMVLSSSPFKHHFHPHNGHSNNHKHGKNNPHSSSSSVDSSRRSSVGSKHHNTVSAKSNTDIPTTTSSTGPTSDYKTSLKRDRANHQAATELASLLWICAHEMSLEDYGMVESETFTSVFSLVHSKGNMDRRMAGLAALDALIDAPSADEERKAIKFANTLSGGLRSARGDYEFLSAVSKALGHMATRTANVDFVESEVTRALEWLRTDRSDRRYVQSGFKKFKTHIIRNTEVQLVLR